MREAIEEYVMRLEAYLQGGFVDIDDMRDMLNKLKEDLRESE